jgi:hypothetical protein
MDKGKRRKETLTYSASALSAIAGKTIHKIVRAAIVNGNAVLTVEVLTAETSTPRH